MNAKTTRILKEARPLFWPWCAVILTALLPLADPPQLMNLIWVIGILLGIPLLVALPLGNEFQHRTLSLLLSQPVERMEIWGEKLIVTVVAVLTAFLCFYLTLRATGLGQSWEVWAFGGAWIVAITASATFWTLFARSTVGGVVLNIGVQCFVAFTVSRANLAAWLRARGYLSPLNPIAVSGVVFAFLCYAGGMLWLGGRMLARFQATGGMGSDDLLMAGPDVIPGALGGWLRCRPTGTVLNLIRKELRLLRPVWLLSLLAAVGWACLSLFGLLYERRSTENFQIAMVTVGVISTLMIATLAGSLSLGEEMTSGTHAWHLTLPVSARRQWFIKLCMALFAGLVGAGLLPMLIAGPLFGKYHILADINLRVALPLVVVLLSFAAFWCAGVGKGTVSAVLWVLPVMIALFFAGEVGRRAGYAITALFFGRFHPSATLRVANAISSLFKTLAISRYAFWEFFSNRGYITPLVGAVLVPTLLLAAIQSYRIFRAQLQAGVLSMVRNLLPLAMVAFLCTFSLQALVTLELGAQSPESRALFETIRAIQTLPSRAAKLDAAHPLQFTVDDLAKASPLSKSARRWLGDSHITLSLDAPPHQRGFGCAGGPPPSGVSALGYSWYTAIVPLADGTHLFMAFDPVTHQTISLGLCK